MCENSFLGLVKLKFLLLILLACLDVFCSWPEGQIRTIFNGSLLRGSNSMHPTINHYEYTMVQFAMANSGIKKNLGYGLGLEWARKGVVVKGGFQNELLVEKPRYLEYFNHDLSVSKNFESFALPFSVGLGFENETWCGINDCEFDRNYRLLGAWILNEQIEIIFSEQQGFIESHSAGVHLGMNQASFEIEYHLSESESIWVYRQIWNFGKLGLASFLLGSEFLSNPFLWSIWGEFNTDLLFLRPKVFGAKQLGNRIEIEIGLFF
jgi:hypothetical protein